MDISHILNQVKSPFTDEKIINLIKKFIECNCDMSEFYRSININIEEKQNPYLTELYSRLFSIFNRGERFVDVNKSWYIIGSSKETLSVPNEMENRVPIYRIYINAKGQDKVKIVEEYIRKCEYTGQTYKLKYSKTDGRNDEILVLSYGEELAKNIELIESITDEINLREPAQLTGKYKGKIGIGEEYIQAPIYSYTQTRLGIIPIIMQKYFLDHRAEFDRYLDEKDKGLGNYLLDYFKKKVSRYQKRIDQLPENKEHQKEELKKQQLACQNNINLDFMDMYNSVCQYIPEVMRTYMKDHSETAIPEILENYRSTCELFGISREGVFSQMTEEMLGQQKQTPLQQREAELSSLEAEEKQLKARIDKQVEQEGQDIGEN